MKAKKYDKENMNNQDTQTTIDLKGWLTQVEFARKYDMKLTTVSRWVKRAKDGEGTRKIDFLDVPSLGITLVKPL